MQNDEPTVHVQNDANEPASVHDQDDAKSSSVHIQDDAHEPVPAVVDNAHGPVPLVAEDDAQELVPGPVQDLLEDTAERAVESVARDNVEEQALQENLIDVELDPLIHEAGECVPAIVLEQPQEQPHDECARSISQDDCQTPANGGPSAVEIFSSTEPSQYSWTPGTYVLVNARSGTALDLSCGDFRTLTGWPLHGEQNQQWEFVPSGRGYVIRSVCSSSCGMYLTVTDGLYDNVALVASPFPVSWDVQVIEHESAISLRRAFRIAWPGTDYVMDLADWGCDAPGTKVQLVKHKPREPCQMWRFIPRPASVDVVEKVAQAAMQPILTETIIVSEGTDFVTTTRTTTTTTVTTVTTVTKTARHRVL
ncbi:hypothetical protein BKA93DRAFT_734718 [Sparassis latifolia]